LGCSITGSADSSSAAINLTTEGSIDWEHWGESALNRKTGVTPQLGSYQGIGNGSILTYNNDPRLVNWSDGTPTLGSSNNADGIYISGMGQGFSFTAPADTTVRTLKVHVGGWFSGGTLTAHLSDGSAQDFTDVTASINGQYDRNYILSYQAGSAGQTLLITWVMTSGASYGNVTLNAAALLGSTSGGSTLVGSTIEANAGTPQNTPVSTAFPIALEAEVLDSGGNPVSGTPVTFTAPSSGATATFAGSPTITAITDSNGVATVSGPVANAEAGSYLVVASAAGLGTSAAFSLTNNQASAATIAASAGSSQNATVNTAFAISLQAIVTDAYSNPLSGVTVTFAAPTVGPSGTFAASSSATAITNASGIAIAPSLTANNKTGSYTITATVSGAALSASFNLTNTAAASGTGSLSGIADSAITPVNLTAEGTADWVHWGDAGTPFNRKAGVTPQISTYSIVGSGLVLTINNDPRPISWIDGLPTATRTNDQEALYINNLNNGFSLTVPAGITAATLYVHAGGFMSGGTLTAHLSDSSAPDYVDRTAIVSGQYDRNYTLTYNAASSGQTLTVTWVDTLGGGNVTLSGAALQ